MKRLPMNTPARAPRPRTAHRGCGPGARPAGLALIEIMIALALGLVIIAALGQLYAGSKQSYVLGDAMIRLTENGRFAIDFLSAEIRVAGYLSCGGASASLGNSVNGGTNWLYQTTGVQGYEGSVSQLPTGFATGQVRAGTDILVLRHAAVDLEQSLTAHSSSTAIMKFGVIHDFKVGEILVISNPSCTQTTLFQVKGTSNIDHPGVENAFDAVTYGATPSGAPGMVPDNCTDLLFGAFTCSSFAVNAKSGTFPAKSVVSHYAVNAYYITAADPPALVRRSLGTDGQLTTAPEELIRDVEDFQVLYGRDTHPDSTHRVDDYVTANLVTDWTTVVSIHFALLMRSRDARVRAAETSLSYDMLGTQVPAAADRRLRRSFSSLVAVRNNLP